MTETAPEPDLDHRPHSRACGIKRHDHGPECHPNCPTCAGRPVAPPEPDRDPAVYSNQGTVRPDGGIDYYTWRALAERQEEDLARLRGFQALVLDLDRNPNGRHEGDADVGAQGGISQGNPKFTTGDVVGYGIGGQPIIMPPRGKRHDPQAWRAGR